jgi:hypothetical protein
VKLERNVFRLARRASLETLKDLLLEVGHVLFRFWVIAEFDRVLHSHLPPVLITRVDEKVAKPTKHSSLSHY